MRRSKRTRITPSTRLETGPNPQVLRERVGGWVGGWVGVWVCVCVCGWGGWSHVTLTFEDRNKPAKAAFRAHVTLTCLLAVSGGM